MTMASGACDPRNIAARRACIPLAFAARALACAPRLLHHRSAVWQGSRIGHAKRASEEAGVGDVAAGRRRALKRGVLGALAIGLLLGGGAVLYELHSSLLQSHVLAEFAQRLTFRVEPGASPMVRFPPPAPYDDRLGYSRLPDFIERLQAPRLRHRGAGADLARDGRGRRAWPQPALPRQDARRTGRRRLPRRAAVPRAFSGSRLRALRTDSADTGAGAALDREPRTARRRQRAAQSRDRMGPPRARRHRPGDRALRSGPRHPRRQHARHADREVPPFARRPHVVGAGEAAPDGVGHPARVHRRRGHHRRAARPRARLRQLGAALGAHRRRRDQRRRRRPRRLVRPRSRRSERPARERIAERTVRARRSLQAGAVAAGGRAAAVVLPAAEPRGAGSAHQLAPAPARRGGHHSRRAARRRRLAEAHARRPARRRRATAAFRTAQGGDRRTRRHRQHAPALRGSTTSTASTSPPRRVSISACSSRSPASCATCAIPRRRVPPTSSRPSCSSAATRRR